MVFPRENGLLALSKFVAICALSSGAILSADASNDAAMAVCTQVVSSGDAAVGINIISDASCSAGGLGCIDSICRFCKTTDTAQSKHLLTCASLLPTTAPAATTAAPASTTAPPATTTAAPAATIAVPAASTAAPTTTTCTASSSDIAVGVQAIPDTSCLAGGLGCFTAGCRFCKYSETPKSAHLLTCSSFGYNWPTLAPVPVATVGTGACGISDGDLAVGIRAIDDATCLNGGLGCYSDHCRYCKVSVTPQSAHLADCSSYSIAPTPAPLTTTEAPVSTTAPPVSTTAVPVSTTAAPAEATPTPSGTIATWTDVTNNTCSIGEDSKAVGIDVVADATVTGDDADYYIDGCRFCKITDSASLASFTLCSLFPNYAAATTAPTAAPTVCSTPVSAGDAAVGIQIVSDATCVAGGVGCIDSICRFCKISVTPQSAHLTDCAVILDPSATPMPTPASVTTAPAPSTVASTVCSTPVSAGDAAVGIQIFTDATCVAGGVGCIDSICRFCKTSTTPQSAHLIDCPGTAAPAVTTAAPAVTTAATVATCATPVSEGDAAVGIQIFSDATCVAGGVGCIDSICRFCKISTTPQSAHLIDCPGTAAPAATTSAPATTTTAPATTTSTPSVTTAQPIFDPTDITGTSCSLPDDYKSLGIDVVLDPTVTDKDNDYYLLGCRFCKTAETSDSAEFTSCALFAGYGATTTPATSAPVTTGTAAPATTAAPTGGCTQVVSEGDAAVGVQITTDASCVNGGVGCIDSICRFCKVSETPQSTNFVDCSSIVVTTAPAATTAAPATTTATPATTTVDSVTTTAAPATTTAAPVTATAAPATTSLCTVNAGDAAVGIQAIADASCASGGLGCYSDSCRFCKATTTPQSAHLGDCSSYTASTAAPATMTAAPATDGTTTAPATTTAVPVTTIATTTAPIVSGSCTVSAGDAAVGIQAIADATCASGGLGCYSDSCRYCQATPTTQSAHLGLCSSYTASTITTTPAPATTTAVPATTTAAPTTTTGTTAPITTVAPAVAGTCTVSSGDAVVGIQAFTDASCAIGGIGCYTDSCRYCKTSVTTQSANFVDCPGATTTTTTTTSAPAETTAPPSTTTATSAPAETTAAPTTTTAAPATTTAVPATTVAPAGCAVTSGDAAVGIQAFTDATCGIGGIGCYTDSCRYCKTSVTTQSANFVDCPGTTTATTATTTVPAETTAAPTVDPVAIACAGQTLSQGDIDGGVAFTVDTAHCPTGTTVGCIGTASCKFCKEFNSTVSSHLDWCPGYPVTSTSLSVKSSADETTATGLAGKIEKLMKHHKVVLPVAIAACVGVIAVIALVVVGTKRAVRRMRRGSSSMSEFDDDEDEEEGSVLASVTKDNAAATATGVTAEEAEASLSAQV